MNRFAIAVLITLLVISGVVWYSGVLSPVVQEPTGSSNNAGSGSMMPTLPADGSSAGFAKLGPNAIYVAEQWPGKELVINIVNIASPGYVVIHESNDGKPGAIIGNSALIETAEVKNIKVTLKRAAKDGEELIAMLHTEKGVAGFDPTADLPVLDIDGNPIHAIFQVDANAPDPSSVQVMF